MSIQKDLPCFQNNLLCFVLYILGIPPTDDQIYSEETAEIYENLDFQCPGLWGNWDTFGPIYGPLVKSEFFFFYVFSAQWIPLLFYNAEPQGYL